jgi:hypothetical protein
MTLAEQIIKAFPELEGTQVFTDGTINLQNDSDGSGDYIASWNYSKDIPKNLESFKR